MHRPYQRYQIPLSVIAQYQAGATLSEIARETKCHHGSISAFLKRNGVEVKNNNKKTAEIDLGLALLSTVCNPGVELTLEDIAAWCNCSRERIRQIEEIALRKMRKKLKAFLTPEELSCYPQLEEMI